MRKGFTMVELLTVIAIIAILAAIIFPVAGTVRENARRQRCMANLSQIYTALMEYKNDYRAFPPVLGAYAVNQNGVLTCNQTEAVPFNFAPKPLGNYLKNDEIFYCPNNPVNDKRLITQAVYPQGHALAGQIVQIGNQPVCFYRYDSYTISKQGNTSVYELHYTLFWSDRNLNQEENRRNNNLTNYGAGYYTNPVGPKASDNPRQLGYRNPDTTAVITWCSYHRSYQGSQPVRARNDIVLFLTGNTKMVDSLEMFQYPYHARP